MSRRPFVRALGALLVPAALSAQGSISAQGFGYPTGQLTARSTATGGGMAEFDAATPLNPAALSSWVVMGAYGQYSPERRTTSVGGNSISALLPRFPVFGFGLPVGRKITVGVAASSLLERTFFTQTSARQLVRDDSITVVTTNNLRGNMSDLRFAVAWQPREWLSVGGAWHFIGGENRAAIRRLFIREAGGVADSATYQPITERAELGFSGQAFSLGVDVRPVKDLYVAASMRRGFSLESRVGSFVASRADVPDRWGIGVRYDGLGGARFAARYENVLWSQMASLGSGNTRTFDATEYGAGVEINGPQIQKLPTELRLGWRQRTLPFGVGAVQPEERGIGGGLALPFGRGRFIIDVGVERLTRTVAGVAGVSENAWTTAVGVRIRP
jgi:hypothetical protein